MSSKKLFNSNMINYGCSISGKACFIVSALCCLAVGIIFFFGIVDNKINNVFILLMFSSPFIFSGIHMLYRGIKTIKLQKTKLDYDYIAKLQSAITEFTVNIDFEVEVEDVYFVIKVHSNNFTVTNKDTSRTFRLTMPMHYNCVNVGDIFGYEVIVPKDNPWQTYTQRVLFSLDGNIRCGMSVERHNEHIQYRSLTDSSIF